MHPYIPITEADEKVMLKEINALNIEDLFCDIPESIRLKKNLDLKDSMSEIELMKYMKNIANKNNSELTCFLGAGAYDHYIPSIIKHIP